MTKKILRKMFNLLFGIYNFPSFCISYSYFILLNYEPETIPVNVVKVSEETTNVLPHKRSNDCIEQHVEEQISSHYCNHSYWDYGD